MIIPHGIKPPDFLEMMAQSKIDTSPLQRLAENYVAGQRRAPIEAREAEKHALTLQQLREQGVRNTEMHPLDMDHKRAATELAKANAEKVRLAPAGGERPMNVKEYEYWRGLPTDAARSEYLTLRRADKFLNTGTAHVLPDKINPAGTPRAVVPINIAEREAAEKLGQAQGQAQADLPRAKHGAVTMVKYIDAILNDANLPNVTGLEGNFPTWRAKSVDTESRIKQVQGGVFLEAFKELKGGGAITELEGAKAEQAKARLVNMKQSDAGYRAALEELRNEVMDLYRLAEMRARGAGPYVPPAGTPTDAVPRANADRLPPAGGWSIKRID